MFAGIDKDIQKIFFALNAETLDTLFKKYGQLHGKNAEEYARKTFPQWENGKTILSGQTAERLLNLIPPYLPQNTKYDLVKKLRDYYLKKQTKHISTTYEKWKDDVIPAINNLIKVSSDFKLPETLMQRAVWLTNGDVDAVNKILASLEHEEARIRVSYLAIEFERMQHLVDHVPHTQSIRHLIELPQGNINVIIEKEKQTFMQRLFRGNPMKSKQKQLASEEKLQIALIQQQKLGNLLEISLDDLDNEQRKQLAEKMINYRIELERQKAEADMKNINVNKDMETLIQTVKDLEAYAEGGYGVDVETETPSGKMTIRVDNDNSKHKNTVIIVVAIVIGVIVLAMMK